MKKLFSIVMIALMSIVTLNAETTRIYCKMSQSWWKADGAAVGCHSWGTGQGTSWPGVRMTPVEGETDMWYIDLDVTKVQNVIFTRVNPSDQGNLDWGAKTKDLQIPNDDKNLFTITSTEAVWGDPGCEGEWSKYEVPVPTEPAVTKIEIEGDMSVAGSELTFWVTVAGFSAEPRVTFEVKAGEGEYEQLQGNRFTPTANGNYTIKATAIYRNDEEGINEEAYKEVDFTIGTPAAGITVNVTVPVGTPTCYFYGEMSNNKFVEMDKVDDTHYTTEFPDATTIGWGYLFAWENGNWNTKNADPEGDIKVEPVNGVIDVEVKAWATAPQPVGTFDLTIVQDTVWSKDNAKIAAWIWGEELSGQWTSWATNLNDTLTLKVDERADSIILVRNSPEATEPTWEAWSRIDAGEIDDCHLFIITNWNEGVWCERPVVETKYYAKNNWNGAAADDWSWLEMSVTDRENIYMLDSVVFGGTGVNINDKEEDATAIWFAADKIRVLDGLDGFPGPIPPDPKKRDTLIWAPARTSVVLETPTLLAGDTIKLFFNAKDSTLSAAIVGRPEQPEPVGTFDLTIVQDTLWTKDGGKVAGWIWGEELAGQWTAWATDEEGVLTLKVNVKADSIILVRNAPEATEPTWEAWSRIDAGEIDDCHIYYILDWNAGVWCERPQPVGEKYYITGNEALVAEKAWDAQAIEMTDGAYTFTAMAAGDYEMKITNGAWDPEGQSWGAEALSEDCSAGVDNKDGNIHFVVETPNDVTVSIAEGKVTVIGTFKQEEPAKTFDLTIVQDTLWTKDGGKVAGWIWGEELAGQWTAWATDEEGVLTLKVNVKADSIILVRNAPEATEPTWEAWSRIDAGEIDECHLFIITNWNEGVWCERPEPCEGQFGILVNETYIPAALNEARQDVVEYMLLDVALNAGDLVQIYDKCNEVAWIITEYMPDSYQFHVTPENKYIIQDGEADTYSFYFQLGPDKLYVLKGQSPTGMNEIESNATIQKIVRDGHLYIMVNEQVYNVQGIRVQ